MPAAAVIAGRLSRRAHELAVPGESDGDGSLRTRFVDVQRARIVSAMCELCCERGVGDVSVAAVVARSGVSRRTFYEVFDDREDCFRAAFEHALACAAERVVRAYRAAGDRWRERVRAGLLELLGFLDEEPALARVLVVESLAGGPRVRERRRGALEQLVQALEAGAAERGSAVPSLPLAGEAIVGGALAVVEGRLREGAQTPLVELANPLMSMIVLPYRGGAAARRELARPLPARSEPHGSAPPAGDPFKDAGLRLTYRTVRVLSAIAEHPGVSNRTIGKLAGLADQGQTSRLLGRLRRAEMIANATAGAGQGGANAWELTDRGRQVMQTIHVHTEDAR